MPAVFLGASMKPKTISLIYTDQDGKLQEDPGLTAVGLNGQQAEVADATWIDLPSGGELVLLPGRLPLGFNEDNDELEVVAEDGIAAVAAILPVGYTRCLLPGYEIESLTELPLMGYTAVGATGGQLKVAALKTDEDLKWNPSYYNTPDLPRLIAKQQKRFPANRILTQLAKCALEYHCLTAQNIFYQRWEAGIPVSPVCNSDCLGCISKQPAECCPSPQGRIKFVPTVKEVVELAVDHLESAPEAIISFGQGCEGEPSLQRELLLESIREIRCLTTKGTININTNAGYYESIRSLIDNGLDSIRVSLFSARPENYQWYHRPQGYQLSEVIQSLGYAAAGGAMVALNLLLYPGFTNQIQEVEALCDLLTKTNIQQIQLRNLNLDPEKIQTKLLAEELPRITEWLQSLTSKFPALQIGNYTRPRA